MVILAHRGFWRRSSDQNTLHAFQKALELDFGIETDIRDQHQNIVISHDPPKKTTLQLDHLLQIVAKSHKNILALNIKSEGLQNNLIAAIQKFNFKNYFLFDMSIPETLKSLKMGLRCFVRQSDIEPEPVLYDLAHGIWIDAFYNDAWITNLNIYRHLKSGKAVCVVSPELHGRNPIPLWRRLKKTNLAYSSKLMLCTDTPIRARSFFEKNK